VDTVEVDVVKCALQLKATVGSGMGKLNKRCAGSQGYCNERHGDRGYKGGKVCPRHHTEPIHVDDTYFMLVGFQTGWAAVGLTLKMIKDSTFVRTGSFFHLDDARGIVAEEVESRVWSRPEVVRRELTLL